MKFVINADLCYSPDCQVCFDICPNNAIRLRGFGLQSPGRYGTVSTPHIVQDACAGCGRCFENAKQYSKCRAIEKIR